jgi:non-specific serine/threonine protein kinase
MPEITIETLDVTRLKRAAGQLIFDRGEAYYHWGRVQIESVSSQFARCYVNGSRLYEVEISVSDEYLYLRCDCPYAANGVVCKHDVAAALAVRDYLIQRTPPHWSDHLKTVLQAARSSSRSAKPRQYLLFFSLQGVSIPTYTSWKVTPYQIPLNTLPREFISGDRTAPNELLQKIVDEEPSLAAQARTPYNVLNPHGCANCEQESVVLANMLIERARSFSYYSSAFSLDDILSLIASTKSPLFLGDARNPMNKRLQIQSEAGELRLHIERDSQGVHLKARVVAGQQTINLQLNDEQKEIQIISAIPLWVLADANLFKLVNENESEAITEWLRQPTVDIPYEEEDNFLETYYLPLARQFKLEGQNIQWEDVQANPIPRLYLSEVKGKLKAQLRFGYGDYELSYDADLPAKGVVRKPETWTLVRIQRQPSLEEAQFRSLSTAAYRLKRAPKPAKPGNFVMRANAHPIDFLLHSVPRLVQDGYEIYGEERLKTLHVNRNKPSISFNISSGIDWFDVKTVVNFGQIEVSLKEIRRALRRKEHYIKLADGSIGEIPDDWVERYKHLFVFGEERGDSLRFSASQVTLVDQLIEGSEKTRTDGEFERRRQQLRNFSGIDSVELPDSFRGDLRPYQKAGYDWLHFLQEFSFGGCLADDMGLGKTVQALVFLQSLRKGIGNKDPKKPTHADLIVVPRSLLVNWQREAARFTPELRILEYFEADRPRDISSFDQYDLVITTYGIMRRDVKVLRKYTFHYVLLDESQTIKNPLAQTSKAARLLQARNRLALTGTPVENSTVELWSLFAFLNPGLLGGLDYFKKEFGTPIEKKGDEKSARLLRKMVYPFVLRRTKAQVAPELPPRSERILYSDMEPAQRKLYNRMRDYYRGMLLGMLEKEGINASRMKILEGLLRLRQIANHPRLVESKFRGASGKFDLLMETLDTLQAEGHKALVFSQFVQMLRLVREPLDNRKIPYAYLDGHTQNRQERVDRFQNDPDIPLFLISLKAGGLGLNLTAADYVIHIDPWWNPAVEMQATDRTHRIGQDKPVIVYKLITRDSVEEKILKLQEQKKNLVDQLITTESSFFKSLTQEEVGVLFS